LIWAALTKSRLARGDITPAEASWSSLTAFYLLSDLDVLAMFFMMAALVAVPESQGINSPLEAVVACLSLAYCSSPLLYLRRRTVRFLGELQIRSNCVNTSLICFINSLVLGDCRNFTVLMKADLN
jgi:hypothetical protein